MFPSCFVNISYFDAPFPQVSIGLAVFCVPYLRWKHPEWERPIKVNLVFPVLYVLATIVITGLPMIITPIETIIGLAMVFSGVPVYFIFVWWQNKPEMIRRWSSEY